MNKNDKDINERVAKSADGYDHCERYKYLAEYHNTTTDTIRKLISLAKQHNTTIDIILLYKKIWNKLPSRYADENFKNEMKVVDRHMKIEKMKNKLKKFIKVPFTDEQVKNLNEYQANGKFHEFTCECQGDDAHIKYEFEKQHKGKNYKEYLKMEKANGINYPDAVFNSTALIATKDGWICPVCNYKQNWAHRFMSEK